MKHFFLLLGFLLVCSSALAYVSSDDAVRFISSNNYLYPGEVLEITPLVKIQHDSDQYWVATVLAGDTPTGFIAVKDALQVEIPSKRSINEALFRTAYVLRNYSDAKQGFQSQWFFLSSNADYFNSLSRILRNEKENDLSIIASTANDAAITSKVNSMKALLDSMGANSSMLSEQINSQISFESNYLNAPKTNELDKFQDGFTSVFSLMDSLQENALEYESAATSLKNLLASSSISADQKQQLLSLANAPAELYGISSKQGISSNNKQSLSEIFSSAVSKAIIFTDNLLTRQKMAEAKNALYSDDSSLKNLSGQTVSLAEAKNEILNPSLLEQWKNQAEVSRLQEMWNKAEQNFQQGSYENAIAFALKAKTSAKAVYADGFAEQPETEFDFAALSWQIAVGLVALLAVLFILKNRHKILGAIAKESPEEEEQYPRFGRI